eukprot:325656-Pelagomonas_calceolata.AAC.4
MALCASGTCERLGASGLMRAELLSIPCSCILIRVNSYQVGAQSMYADRMSRGGPFSPSCNWSLGVCDQDI